HALPTSEIYTLSLHDALPIFDVPAALDIELSDVAVKERDRVALIILEHIGDDHHGITVRPARDSPVGQSIDGSGRHRKERGSARSEEHTSELQSRENLVCSLL